MHIANSDKPVKFYSLDIMLVVGYPVNSNQATRFRIWATKTLKQHLLDGYTINKKQLIKNYQKFQASLKDIKALLPADKPISAEDALELVPTLTLNFVIFFRNSLNIRVLEN